jgi:7-cyano-7-deazaguanine synthase
MVTAGASGREHPVPILWTGGWDSTFRVLQLLLVERRSVQPHYVLNPERPGLHRELGARSAITAAVSQRLPEGVRLLPTAFALRDEVPVGRWRATVLDLGLSFQNAWLAAIVEQRGWAGIELCISRSDANWTSYFERDADGRASLVDGPGRDLFGLFRYPLIDLTRRDMVAISREHGFLDLLQLRWFCWFPSERGRACGTCPPCHQVRRHAREAPEVLGGVRFRSMLGRGTRRLFPPPGTRDLDPFVWGLRVRRRRLVKRTRRLLARWHPRRWVR